MKCDKLLVSSQNKATITVNLIRKFKDRFAVKSLTEFQALSH